jgi:hypothetical protein
MSKPYEQGVMTIAQHLHPFKPLQLVGLSHAIIATHQMMVSLVANEGRVQCEPIFNVSNMHVTYKVFYLFHGKTLFYPLLTNEQCNKRCTLKHCY